jgi:hypothetical protein
MNTAIWIKDISVTRRTIYRNVNGTGLIIENWRDSGKFHVMIKNISRETYLRKPEPSSMYDTFEDAERNFERLLKNIDT